jgi:DinB superfamily
MAASRARFYQQETTVTDLDTLRYPVGKFERIQPPLDRATREKHIVTIEQLPARLRALTNGLTESQLEARYRPGGWTIRQVVHHVPESHMNAYVRFKLALTEDAPTIKTYEEQLWAELPDVRRCSIDVSLRLLEALHERWVALLRALPDRDFVRVFIHKDWGRVTIDEAVAMYAWHSRHHTAHIQNAVAGAVA